jgi:hypothetical protein
MRWRAGVVAVGALLAAPACSRFVDAKVYNPCRHPIEVRLWTATVSPFQRDHKPLIRVEPASTRIVEEALGDPEADDYTAEVLLPYGETEFLDFEPGPEPVEVLVPVDYCDPTAE